MMNLYAVTFNRHWSHYVAAVMRVSNAKFMYQSTVKYKLEWDHVHSTMGVNGIKFNPISMFYTLQFHI